MANWYIQIMGETLGPLSAAELQAKATEHQIESDTLVRKGPEGEWLLASKVKGLLPETGPLPPQPENPKGSGTADEAESVAADVLGYERQSKQDRRTQEKQERQPVTQVDNALRRRWETAVEKVQAFQPEASAFYKPYPVLTIVKSAYRIVGLFVLVIAGFVFVIGGITAIGNLSKFPFASWAASVVLSVIAGITCFATAELIDLAMTVAHDIRVTRWLTKIAAYRDLTE